MVIMEKILSRKFSWDFVSVFQIREVSQVKTQRKLASWPDKLNALNLKRTRATDPSKILHWHSFFESDLEHRLAFNEKRASDFENVYLEHLILQYFLEPTDNPL